jgi:hypothetical protein
MEQGQRRTLEEMSLVLPPIRPLFSFRRLSLWLVLQKRTGARRPLLAALRLALARMASRRLKIDVSTFGLPQFETYWLTLRQHCPAGCLPRPQAVPGLLTPIARRIIQVILDAPGLGAELVHGSTGH